jgi:hypothetical protein
LGNVEKVKIFDLSLPVSHLLRHGTAIVHPIISSAAGSPFAGLQALYSNDYFMIIHNRLQLTVIKTNKKI